MQSGSKILDIGCGKGYLLKEIYDINPKIKIYGIDLSNYAIRNSHKDIKKFLFKYDVRNKLPFKKKEFDLVISLGVLHNLYLYELKKILSNIDEIATFKYIMVESYRNNKELTNLQCWALTCNSFLHVKEWLYLFKETGYKGDYEFIFFE